MDNNLRNGQSESQMRNSPQLKPTERNVDVPVSNIMSEIYHQGFIKIISKQKPGIVGRMETFVARLRAGRHRRPLSETNFGFRIHFGDIQRLYMRSLHAKLIGMAVRVKKKRSSKGREDVVEGLEKFGDLLEKYSKRLIPSESMLLSVCLIN